jgi:hypothetical protein
MGVEGHGNAMLPIPLRLSGPARSNVERVSEAEERG